MTSRIVATWPSKDGFGFFTFADDIAKPVVPPPLRQILSLMRVQGVEFLVDTVDDTPIGLSEEHQRLDREWREQQREGAAGIATTYRDRKVWFFKGLLHHNPFSDDLSLAAKRMPEDKRIFRHLCSSASAKPVCLGFLVLRTLLDRNSEPTSTFVDKAVIAHPPRDKEHHYIHSSARFRTVALGEVFHVEGSFFAQQGGAESSCAHAALRVCIENVRAATRKRIGTNYQDLNQLLSRMAGGSSNPRNGLEDEQIKFVLERQVELDWELYYTPDQTESETESVRDLSRKYLTYLYYAVEAGMPAILVFQGDTYLHAMAVIGHTFNGSLWQDAVADAYREPEAPPYFPSHKWVEGLVIQDDNFGPYCTLPRKLLIEKPLYVCIPKFKWSKHYAHDIEIFAAKLLHAGLGPEPTGLLDTIRAVYPNPGYWFEQLAKHVVRREHVLRTVAVASADYLDFLEQEHILESGSSLWQRVQGTLERVLRDKDRVRIRVWMVEISIPELYHRCNHRLAELLIVSEDDPQNPKALFLRLPGVFYFFGDTHKPVSKSQGAYHYPIWRRPPNLLAKLID